MRVGLGVFAIGCLLFLNVSVAQDVGASLWLGLRRCLVLGVSDVPYRVVSNNSSGGPGLNVGSVSTAMVLPPQALQPSPSHRPPSRTGTAPSMWTIGLTVKSLNT